MPPKKRGIRRRQGLVHRPDDEVPELLEGSDDEAPVAKAAPLRPGLRRRVGVHVRQSAESATEPSETTRRAGGIRSRQGLNKSSASSRGAASSRATAATSTEKPFNDFLKKKFADGRLQATEVEEAFRTAAQQGVTGAPNLSSPNWPQNLQRSLMAAWGNVEGAPEIQFRMIPTKLGLIPHPFLLPHEFFGALHASKPAFFSKSVSGPIGAARRFWENMSGTDFVRQHPHMADIDTSKLVPLGMHGDAGKFSNQDNLYIFTWNSLLGECPQGSSRFLMTAIRKSIMLPETVDAIAKVLGWSFNVLLTGLTAALDENEEPLPGQQKFIAARWKGVLTKVRGDWEFYKSVFKVPDWSHLGRMCFLCAAVGSNDSPLRYSRTDARAPWRRTRQAHESLVRWCLAHEIPIAAFSATSKDFAQSVS